MVSRHGCRYSNTAIHFCVSIVLLSLNIFHILNSFVKQKSDSLKYVRKEDPDIFCVQETKCDESNLPKVSRI